MKLLLLFNVAHAQHSPLRWVFQASTSILYTAEKVKSCSVNKEFAVQLRSDNTDLIEVHGCIASGQRFHEKYTKNPAQ